MRLEDLGIIGNCQYSALISNRGSVVWCCLPRFDSDPIFASLLDEENGGRFTICPAENTAGIQRYITNTNILETIFETPSGSFRVIDFAPRFFQHARSFRPTQLFRIVEPVSGSPMIRVQCDPRLGWSKEAPRSFAGSHHIEYEGFSNRLRFTSDIPLSYTDGRPFVLTERKHLVLTWGAPVEEPLGPLSHRFLEETTEYWERWVKHCDVPADYQEDVIRSALVLKLHCYEDTGAIVAALTTSLPEAPGSQRTWDYRYCWLRDAFYVLGAFRLLGHFEEREQFLEFLINVAAQAPDLNLQPLYRVDGGTQLEERILDHWPGYLNEKPVRVGNAAASQKQNDVFGEMVLALCPAFLDARFRGEQTSEVLDLLERLARKAEAVAGTEDAGIWEFRTKSHAQTFSSLMSWAAADRMALVAGAHRPSLGAHFTDAAKRLHAEIVKRAWNTTKQSFVAYYDGSELDASLLQLVSLRFLPPDDPRLASTIDAVIRELTDEGWLLRYRAADDFGVPEVAFTLCTFWLAESLARISRKSEARDIYERARKAMSPLGLLSEDYAVRTGRMWGNFPQAYSHVGLIHAAFACSPSWSEII